MLQWLHLLEVKPGSVRHTRTGYVCMQRGWTQWDYRDSQGEMISLAEAEKQWGKPDMWAHIVGNGERITDAGKAILELHWPGRWGKHHDIEDDYADRAEWQSRRSR